jgi:hypothetical protein
MGLNQDTLNKLSSSNTDSARRSITDRPKVNEATEQQAEKVDSVSVVALKKNESLLPVKHPNFFYTEYTPNLKSQPRILDSTGWIVPLILLSFFLLSLIHVIYPKAFFSLVANIFRLGGIRKLRDEESATNRGALALLMLIFLLVFPVFLFQVVSYFRVVPIVFEGIPLYFRLLLLTSFLLLGKLLSVQVLGYLFNCQDETMDYRNGILLMNGLAVFILIPISLVLKIADADLIKAGIYLGGLFFLIFYCFSILIGLRSGWRSTQVSKFHLFLYFCTLEVLPVFLIAKSMKAII